MPLLNCLAVTCVYNKEEYCSKGDIKVGGKDAKNPEETCCESFREKKEDSMSNAYGQEPEERIEIKCEAKECVFNDHMDCEAGKVGIGGSNACKSEETVCSTFRCNCH